MNYTKEGGPMISFVRLLSMMLYGINDMEHLFKQQFSHKHLFLSQIPFSEDNLYVLLSLLYR